MSSCVEGTKKCACGVTYGQIATTKRMIQLMADPGDLERETLGSLTQDIFLTAACSREKRLVLLPRTFS